MERFKKILIIAITLIVLIFVCLHMFVNARGRDLLSKKLEDTFHRKVKIGRFSTSFPANVYIKDIEIDGLFKINEIVAGGGLIDIFSNNFNLSFLRVTRPVITLEKNPVKAAAEPAPVTQAATQPEAVSQPESAGQPAQATAAPAAKASNPFAAAPFELLSQFSIGRLIVSEGTVNFVDKSAGDKEITIKVEHINLRVDNLNLSARSSQITSFDIKAAIPWRQGVEKGKISAEGWVNFFKRDMQATVKISDIDGIYLYPYYSTWLDLEKARIEKANLNFSSNINGLNNNVTAECRLELSDIVRKERPAEEPVERQEKIASAVIDMFKSLDQGRIVLDFTIRTKMDRPEFGFGSIKMAVREKISKARGGVVKGAQEVLLLPARLVEGVVKGATNISKAMIDGTFAVGNEIKKSVEQSFKKEPK